MSDDDADPPRPGIDLAREALAKAKERARARGASTGQPRGRSAPRRERSADTGDPLAFGAVIRELFAQQGWEHTEKVASVMGRWDDVVGADVAAHCRPESLEEGRLTVVAESTAWATQLRLLQQVVLDRISRDVGPGVVTSLRVHGPATPDWRKGPRRVVGRGPRDTYG